MAEREGFEPSVQVSSHGHLATPCTQMNILDKHIYIKNKHSKNKFSVENDTR